MSNAWNNIGILVSDTPRQTMAVEIDGKNDKTEKNVREYVHRVYRIQNIESLLSMNNIEMCLVKDTSKITHSIIHEHKYT